MRARAGAEAQTSLHAAGSHLAERRGLEGARGGTRGRAELQSCGRHEGGSCGQAHGGDEQGAERSHARIAEMGKRRNGLAFFAEFLKKEQKNLTLQTLSLTESQEAGDDGLAQRQAGGIRCRSGRGGVSGGINCACMRWHDAGSAPAAALVRLEVDEYAERRRVLP